MRSPYAPAWYFFALPMPKIRYMAFGSGPASDLAWQSCLGEAAEILSVLRRKGDVAFKGYEIGNPKPHLVAPDLVTSADADSPADPGNEGTAAGTSFEQASSSALLERCERAAIYKWWTGHQAAMAVPASWISSVGLDDFVSRARLNAVRERALSIIVLDRWHSVWTLAAVSRDTGGRTPVIGYGAALDPAIAAQKAIGELFQMELGLHIAERSSPAQKSGVQLPVYKRIKAFENECAHLVSPDSEIPLSDLVHDNAGLSVQEIALRHLDSVTLVNLTREDIDIPVCRALTPELPTTRPLRYSGGASPI